MSENISKLSGRKGLQDSLYTKVKSLIDDGKIASKAKSSLAEQYLVGKSTIHATSTFYDFFSDSHQEKEAFICKGSACLCAGTQDKVRQKLSKHIENEKIGDIYCLGRCHEAGAFQLHGENYSGKAIEELDRILETDNNIHLDVFPSEHIKAPSFLCDNQFSSIAEAQDLIQLLINKEKKSTLSSIKKSNLRGRGGAGFPTGLKWESCAKIISDKKYIICNADEGDPGAYSDRYLMEQQAYRVILGMVVCAWVTGSEEGVVYIRAEYPAAIRSIRKTIKQFKDAGLLGQKILDQDHFNFELFVIEGAGAYICGEETALIASIEGRRAEVDVRPPFPTEQGLFKKPTVVNNVETFAAIPSILSLGAERYLQLGTDKSSGTKLVSLDSGFNRPGIYEIELGLPLSTLINEVGGGFNQSMKALHIGGPLGGLVPIEKIDQLKVDFESFSDNGFLLGHASFVCIPSKLPIIEYLLHLFEFTAAESCGKCFPCRLGATRGKEMIQGALKNQQVLNAELFEDLLTTMEKGSLCALGGGLPLPIKNALEYFQDELKPYFEPDHSKRVNGKASHEPRPAKKRRPVK